MKTFIIGSREDVAGFALAGVDGVVCADGEEARQAIGWADEDTLLIVSSEFASGVEPRRLFVVLPPRT